MAEVRLEGVTKVYPDGTTAVSGLDLALADDELLVLVGRRAAARRRRYGWWPVWSTSRPAR
jgi:ABC-type phosphate/phosphonate transport system ATPase subunit